MSQGQSLFLAVAMHQGQSLSIVSIHIDQMLYDLHREEVTEHHIMKSDKQISSPALSVNPACGSVGAKNVAFCVLNQEKIIFILCLILQKQTSTTRMVGPL